MTGKLSSQGIDNISSTLPYCTRIYYILNILYKERHLNLSINIKTFDAFKPARDLEDIFYNVSLYRVARVVKGIFYG